MEVFRRRARIEKHAWVVPKGYRHPAAVRCDQRQSAPSPFKEHGSTTLSDHLVASRDCKHPRVTLALCGGGSCATELFAMLDVRVPSLRRGHATLPGKVLISFDDIMPFIGGVRNSV